MTILQINSVNYGSTGNIMLQIHNYLQENGVDSFVAYPKSRQNNLKDVENNISIGSRLSTNYHINMSYFTGYEERYSFFSTNSFISKIKKLNPDLIHIHNIHGFYLNLPLFFQFLKNFNKPVIWTLHDCWAFTGHCPYYSRINCEKWKNECNNCPLYNEYPKSLFDNSNKMFHIKKKLFNSLCNLTIVTPSDWLRKEVKKSFLSKYNTVVINNGIDIEIFKPTKSNFRHKNNINDKIILLGVANPWSERKGLKTFLKLSEIINDDFRIVLVGLEKKNKDVKKRENITIIDRTSNQKELAAIYSAADYFLNPSVEETMGLTTIESLACGTPVIASNRTAIPEMLTDKCGIVLNDLSAESFYESILKKPIFDKQNLLNHAYKYNKTEKYNEYLSLYKSLL